MSGREKEGIIVMTIRTRTNNSNEHNNTQRTVPYRNNKNKNK